MDRVEFETDDGVWLEGVIRRPDGPQLASAVVCHAHPLYGGSKDHPLLWALRTALARRGVAVLSFNFRGVMRSKGAFGGGVLELMDARAAIGLVREKVQGPTLLVGWSFGANVALRAAVGNPDVAALALIALPLGDTSIGLPPLPSPEAFGTLARPVLLLAGDRDPFCPADRLRALASTMPTGVVTILKGAEHFFERREREVADVVGRFAKGALRLPAPG